MTESERDTGVDAGALSSRRAVGSDLEALSCLEPRCFDRPWTQEDLRPRVEAGEVWVARLLEKGAEGDLVGYAVFQTLAPEAELQRIGVCPERRRTGIARTLLGRSTTELSKLGIDTVYLEVDETNVAALALYGQLGFQARGTRPAYYPDGRSAVLMALDWAQTG